MYFPPLLHPVAIVTKRAAMLPHPTDFTDRNYDEHMNLGLMVTEVGHEWLKMIRPEGQRDFLLDADAVMVSINHTQPTATA